MKNMTNLKSWETCYKWHKKHEQCHKKYDDSHRICHFCFIKGNVEIHHKECDQITCFICILSLWPLESFDANWKVFHLSHKTIKTTIAWIPIVNLHDWDFQHDSDIQHTWDLEDDWDRPPTRLTHSTRLRLSTRLTLKHHWHWNTIDIETRLPFKHDWHLNTIDLQTRLTFKHDWHLNTIDI